MLSSIFILPSIKTLRRIINRNLVIKCGINQNVFDFISIRTKFMKEENTYCTISIDEMSIKSHLYYNINKDEIIGLVDNGQCKSFKSARQTCVFLVRCIFGTWKQPLLYFLHP